MSPRSSDRTSRGTSHDAEHRATLSWPTLPASATCVIPFVIRLADGRGLPAPHPDFVALTPCRVIVGAQDDSWSIVEPLLIVSLDSLPEPGANGNRGSGRKGRAS